MDSEEQQRDGWKMIRKGRRWSSARGQILLTSLIGFCCPGMLNALNGIGGGGNVDPTISALASCGLMAASAASYVFVCVPLFEILGVKSMAVGCWTYALYPLGLLIYARTGSGSFVLLGGVLLGIGSAFFWLVQGAIMISYPLPHQKGTAFAVFWIVFNLGGMAGALIAFWRNRHSGAVEGDEDGEESGTLSSGTYIAFIAIMLLGEALTYFLRPPDRVVRDDGACVSSAIGRTPMGEFVKVAKREAKSLLDIRHEKRVVWLLPMFFAANWFYSYQQNIMNGYSFDLDGRTFNSALYWSAQILGGLAIPLLCDLPPYPTRTRALIAWSTLFTFGNLTLLFGYRFERERETHPQGWIIFGQAGYGAAAGLYFAYGLLDALWQGLCYWLLGISCSSPLAAGKLVAVYKILQALGASIAYAMTMMRVSGYAQFISNWVFVAGALVLALPAVLSVEERESTIEGDGYVPLSAEEDASRGGSRLDTR